GNGEAGSFIIASSASSSSSNRRCLAMLVTQPRPQILQAAELKLLHRPLAARQLVRDLANRLLLGEAHDDHPALVGGEPVDQTKEPRPTLALLRAWLLAKLGSRDVPLARRAERPIRDRVGGDAEEPCRKGYPAPFEVSEVGQRPVEHIGRDVLGFLTVADAAQHEGVDALEVALVQHAEPPRIPLRRLDETGLIDVGDTGGRSAASRHPYLQKPRARRKGYGCPRDRGRRSGDSAGQAAFRAVRRAEHRLPEDPEPSRRPRSRGPHLNVTSAPSPG